MPSSRRFVPILVALLCSLGASAQTTIVRYVDPRADGANNGASWQNAFTSLAAALLSSASTSAIELRVAGQTYTGGFTLSRPAANGPLTILGGFRGLGPSGSPDDRDPAAFPTILDGAGASRVLTISTLNLSNPTFGPAVLIDGLTIRNGLASGPGAAGSGGGVFLNNSGSVSIANCLFEANQAAEGGALHWSSAGAPDPAPVIRNCRFIGNAATVRAGAAVLAVDGLVVDACAFELNTSAGSSGALALDRLVAIDHAQFLQNHASTNGGAIQLDTTAPRLRDCLFTDNAADIDGGAIYLRAGAFSPVLITNCSFFGNIAASRGGGAFLSGLDNGSQSPSTRARLDNCLFYANQAADGGALYDFNAILDMVSCAFSGNTATVRGGAYSSNRNNQVNDGVRRVVNCTFSNNAAPFGGAIARYSGNNTNSVGQSPHWLQILNSVLIENTCSGAAPCGGAVHHSRQGSIASGNAQILLDTSCVDGSIATGAIFSPTSSIGLAANNLLEVDPALILTRPRGLDGQAGTYDDDLTLKPASPCVDQGSNAWLLALADLPDVDGDNDAAEAPPLDASLRQRRQDTVAPNPPIGTPLIVDMGAYEVPECQPCVGESRWRFPISSGFTDLAMWAGGVPDSARDVRFVREGEYTVAFNANTQNRSAAVRAGEVRFALNGRRWTLTAANTTPFVVGAFAGDDAAAIVDGGLLLTGAGAIGRDPDSRGAITMQTAGARWEVAQSLSVGLNGSGELHLTENTSVFSLLGGVGEQPGSRGHVSIDGDGAAWEVLFTLSVSRGSVEVRNGGVLDVGLAAVVFPGGELAGDGTVVSDLINFGLVRPDSSDSAGFTPAALTIDGDYEQLGELPQVGDDTGVLGVTIGAHHQTGAIGVTRLEVGGDAAIAGGLVVSTTPGLDLNGLPIPELRALEARSVDGRFDAALLPGLADGRYFFIDYLSDSGGDAVVLRTNPLAPGFGFEPDVGAVETGVPTAIASADFNADGAEDVVVALPDSDAVVVLLSAGADQSGWLGFATPSILVPVGDQPSGVATGDFNNDGLTDIATCLAGDNAVQILLNDGAGGFAVPGPTETFAVGFEPRALAAADLDNDGDRDIAVACFASDSVVFLVQEPAPMPGMAQFIRALDFAVGDGPRAITLADFENDGSPDIVTSNLLDDTITFIRNQGELRIGLMAFDAPAGEDPDTAPPGDLDEDKDVDLVVAARGGEGAAVVFRNLGGFNFAPAVPLPIGSDPQSLVVVDLDLDGDDDIAAVITNDAGDRVVRVLRNDLTDGQIAFAPAEDLADDNPLLVVAADVDADQNRDLVVIASAPTEEGLRAPPDFIAAASLNAYCPEDINGDGVIQFSDLNILVSAFNTAAGEPGFVPIADINNDGAVGFADLNALLGRFNTGCDGAK